MLSAPRAAVACGNTIPIVGRERRRDTPGMASGTTVQGQRMRAILGAQSEPGRQQQSVRQAEGITGHLSS